MPEKYIIEGADFLQGEINISGAKNAALAILPACILIKGKCIIENVPEINDIDIMLEIIKNLGGNVKFKNNIIEIDCTKVDSYKATFDIVKKIRGSSYLMGALLGRLNNSQVYYPGGCNLGVRPIDQHIKGFEALGAVTEVKHGIIYIKAAKLTGTQIYLDKVTVGATVNIVLASVLADGVTVIENAAKEPHIVDLANFLNTMGANIRGAGTDIIKITGVDELKSGTYSIIPDQIEAGTYMILAASVKSDVLIKNVIPKHLEALSAKLSEAGISVNEFDDSIRIISTGKAGKVNVKTLPHPGFPTDLQPQITTLLSTADGTSVITESIFESRYQYVDELNKMGAQISVDGRTAVVNGIEKLSSTEINAYDLRGGAAMVIAAIKAEGITEVKDIEHIERGYENIITKLKNIGVNIKKKAYK